MGAPKNDHLGRHTQTYLSVALCLTLACFTFIVVGLHEPSNIAYDSYKKVQWRQSFKSVAATHEAPKPIGNFEWAFHYNEIISTLGHITVSPHERVSIDSETLEVLKRASSQLPQNSGSKDLERLSHVIKKSFPGTHGDSLADLFNRYYGYQQETSASLVNLNSAVGDSKRALLLVFSEDNRQRQAHFFGKHNAERLFYKQNQTQNYLNDRRLVRLSTTLTVDEKKQRLGVLQVAYKKSLNND